MTARDRNIERARVRREAKPLGEHIGRMLRAKAEGKDPYSVRPLKKKPLTRRKRSKSQPENAVKQACMQALQDRGIFAWPNNTGMLWAGDRPIRYGKVGSGDIIGCLPDGRFLSVECKAGKNKQSKGQIRFQEDLEANNGVYILAYSGTDLEERLDEIQGVS